MILLKLVILFLLDICYKLVIFGLKLRCCFCVELYFLYLLIVGGCVFIKFILFFKIL